MRGSTGRRLLAAFSALALGVGCDADVAEPGDAGALPNQDGHSHTHAPPTPGSRSDAGLVGDAATLADAGADSYAWSLPKGFAVPKVPVDNAMSEDKAELGRHLFYDKRLSGNGEQACASCHQQELAFTDGKPVGIGSTGEAHIRGAMSLANVAYASTMTWANPVVRSLEDQALVPMFGETPVELGLVGMEDVLLARLRAEPRYLALFAQAFPDAAEPISIANVTRAISAFERTLLSGDAPYDRYLNGDDNALSAEAVRGMKLFFSERTECFHCHGDFTLSDSATYAGKAIDEAAFHNTALYNIDGKGAFPEGNRGLYEFTADPADMGRFKAPTLRNVAVTAPYMHDGSIATLDEVLDHYAAGGRTIKSGPNAGVGSENPYKSELINGFKISAAERAELLAFLQALTDAKFLSDERFADPWP